MAELMISSEGSPLSKPKAQKLGQKINAAARNKFINFLGGVNFYAQADIPKWQPDARVIWQEGSTRILDYGGEGKKILFISPLINRANILDLSGGKSLMKYLKGEGYNPLLVDWGDLSESEVDFTSDDYVARLKKFTTTQKELIIGGYCMGGLLALKLAKVQKAKALILLATPWNFHAPDVKHIETPADVMQRYLEQFSAVPPEFIQSLFLNAAPWRVYNKYSSLEQTSPLPSGGDGGGRKQGRHLPNPNPLPKGEGILLEIEHWVNSGVMMSVPMAKESIIGWTINNTTGRGEWLDVSDIGIPTYLGCPTTDKIVPIGCSIPLAGLLSNVTLQKFVCGHIGMLTKKLCFKPIADWLNRVV